MSSIKLLAGSLLLAFSSLVAAEKLTAVDPMDLYAADDQIVTVDEIDDAFAAARHVVINHTVTGSAHLAGSHIEINAPIQQSLYAFGDSVILSNKVHQDTLSIGRNLLFNGEINGDLRALGESISLNSFISGDVNLAGQQIHINNHIAGNLSVATEHLTFGDNAKVDGKIDIYSDFADSIEVPAHVATAASISRFHEDMDMDTEHYHWQGEMHASGWQLWLGGTLTTFVLSLILTLIARRFVHRAADRINSETGNNLIQGAFGIALLLGGILLSAITIIGLPVSFLLILVTVVALFIAGLVGTYSVGFMIWTRWQQGIPSSFIHILITALIGALLVAVLESIPFIGWLISIMVVMMGLGAINPWQTRRH
jgi:FtsH-binding integral membrane protein